MDYFGWSLWSELMMNNEDWKSSMSLPLNEDGEFVPDKNGWDVIFQRLEDTLEQTGLKGKMGGCYHTSSSIPQVLHRTGLEDEFHQSRDAYKAKTPFEFGMHSTFGRADLVCAGNYPTILQKDLEYCSILGGTSIVEHALILKKKGEARFREMVDELTSDIVVELLQNHPTISLSWENMSDTKTQYCSPARLVDLIHALEDKYKEIGHPELVKQHNLCLDTGHLLLALKKSKKIKTEISDSLPQMAKYLKVFHIHANNGKGDNHIIPDSLEFFNHPSRKGIKPAKFLKNSELVWDWLKICNEHKGMEERHIHLEALRMPFSLTQIVKFGSKYGQLIQ